MSEIYVTGTHQQGEMVEKQIFINLTCELARNDKHNRDTLGIFSVDALASFPWEVIGSLQLEPSG